MSSLKQIRNLIPLGPNGEELHISSNVETGANKFGDAEHWFTVSSNDGVARYRVVLTVAKLRPRIVTDQPGEAGK